MSTEKYVPAVIIGAGPTGATAAIMLAQRGIECLVLERWADVYPLPRAVHFDDEVFRILADLGIGDRLRTISRPAPGMQLVDTKLRVLAQFNRDPNAITHGYPQSNMFHQPELERLLRDRLAQLPQIELRGGVEVIGIDQLTDGPGLVRVRYRDLDTGAESVVWADAVLGSDGANSFTRGCLGIAMEDLGFEQRWLVVDVDSPEPLRAYNGVQQVCHYDRAATFMMVTPGRYRWEFRLRAGEQPDDLDGERIVTRIRPWLGEVDVDKLTVVRRAWYTFRGAVAQRWQDRRVFLLGDAAHLTPPFIGQGMCAGIRDAANLSWKLALVLTGRADDRLLATYEPERSPYARRVILLAMQIGRVISGGSARTAGLRRAAMRAVSRLPGIEDKVLNIAWPAFPTGPLVAPQDRAAGRLCPQPRIGTAHGEIRLDEALGEGFAIITRDRKGVTTHDREAGEFFDAINARVIRLGDPAEGGVVDLDGTLTEMFNKAGAHAVLLRPDRVVAASAGRVDLAAWRRLLESAGITAKAGKATPR
jgi:3-(3-hydroxy-phenyl)propionate hydroxylase